MQIYDIIEKKRDGKVLTRAEISFFIRGICQGAIPDYQTSALLMAMFIRGLNENETLSLTEEMANSGDMLPLRADTCDKHSTGGVGDTATLILLPLVMAVGGKMVKMSGRGLGHTGGTIDKLEAIPGFRTSLSPSEFASNLTSIGAALSSQTGNIAPADKILYALRDVTATVDSLPLIAASVMSKKLALGAGKIVLDVKCGSGAFMKTEADAKALARLMVTIGRRAGRNTKALITRMDAPLGSAIGNTLEVIEAIDVLKGKKGALRDVSVALASLLSNAPASTLEAYIDNGEALSALGRFISAQGGDTGVLSDYTLFKQPKFQKEVQLTGDGFIVGMDAASIGAAACLLGAGRTKKDDPIDPSAGIIMHKTLGSPAKGTLCTLYTDKQDALSKAEEKVRRAIQIHTENLSTPGIIIGTIE